MNHTYDVVIVGGGGSGLAAGVSASNKGLSVVLLEKRPQLGGSTGIAVGSITANGTPQQRRAGIDDNPDAHEEDAGLFGPREIQARNNHEMRRFFLEHSAETVNWLIGMGLRFHGPSPEPPNRVARMHNVVPNAKAYVAVLQSELLRAGGHIVCNARADRLLTDGHRVVGVSATVDGQSVMIEARRGVVLAAGDYANSPEIISRYKGAEFSGIEGINPFCTGDGHMMAKEVGAELVNMDITYGPELRFIAPPREPFSQVLPASGFLGRVMGRCVRLVPGFIMDMMIKRLLVTWQHPEDSLFEDGAILINSRGERFCNERASPEREILISDQPDKLCYILLDRRLVRKYSEWPHFISTAPEIAYAYVADYLRLRPDITVKGERLAELAAARGIPESQLRATVDMYNRYAAGEIADPFGRVGDNRPFDDGSWVLLGPAKAYFTTTEGGVTINRSFQALGTDGKPIEGLYAIGSNGMSGMVLWGHGLHIAWAITSGRMVGEVLASRTASYRASES
jgi:fumarate reductase flavoprotein subunit